MKAKQLGQIRKGEERPNSNRRNRVSSLIIQHENLDDKIYSRLKTMIARGQLEPGERIFPDQLAREMEVSRTPLVNALKRLSQERLIEWVPRRGIYLKKLSNRELAQLFEVREGLESIAARLAATRIDPKEVDELEAMFSEFNENSTTADIRRYVEQDRYFHWRLVEIAANPHLAAAMESVNIMISAYQIGIPRTLAEVLPEHHAILEALRQQNPDASEKAMRIHIRRSADKLKRDAEAEGTEAKDEGNAKKIPNDLGWENRRNMA